METIELPPSIATQQQLAPQRPDPSELKSRHNVIAGHFLSIIAFDGNFTMNTTEAVMLAQQQELKRTAGRTGLWQGWKFHSGEGQVRSRNECAFHFLQSPCEYHLFLDSDLIPTADHVRALRRHPEAKDSIICGVYFKKQPKIEACYNSLEKGNPPPNKLGLMEIAKGGTGFMQIPRSAYEKIMAKFPERFYLCDYAVDRGTMRRGTKYSFFFHDIRIDEQLGFMRDQSEDWAFCELARQAGVKIYLDTTTSGEDHENGGLPPVWHRGQALYPLRTEMERLVLQNNFDELSAKFQSLTGGAKA